MKYRIVADCYGTLFVEKKVLKYFWVRTGRFYGYGVAEIKENILKEIETTRREKLGGTIIEYIGDE